jgi:hypothetical protein
MNGKALLLAAALALIAAAAAPAAADDVVSYETDGAAAAALTDARTRALDVAFAAAVDHALADLVAPADLTAFRGDLDRTIVARARLYVASFKVTEEATRGDELHVSAAVKIDRDRVRAKLTEMGVPTRAAPAPGPGPAIGPGPGPVSSSGPRAVVLLRVSTPTRVIATYGTAAAESVPGAEALAELVRGAGWAQVPAPRSGPAAHAGGDLPLDDDAARALGGDAKARTIVIVGVTIEGAGAVRGARTEGATAIAHVRILDGDQVVGEGVARAGAYAAEDAGAIARAATAAAAAATTAALPRPQGPTGPMTPASPPPPLHAEPGVILVRLRGLAVWTPIRTISAQLAQTSGVEKVSMRRVAPGEVVLAVATKQNAARIAAAVRATEGFAGRAATDDGIVEVTP